MHSLPRATSASQLQTYAACPRKYFFRYVAHEPPAFRSLSLVLGSVVHSVLGYWFDCTGRNHLPSPEEIQHVLRADLCAELAGARIRWKDETPESLEQQAERLAALYIEQYGLEEVVASEVPFEIDLEDPETGEVRGRPMKGYLDFVLERESVVELKTAARAWNKNDLVRHLQVSGYAYADMVRCGGMSDLEVRVLVKLKREPRIQTFHIARGERAIRWFLQAAWAIEGAIAAGHFPPSPGPLCGECEYEGACASWTDEVDPRRTQPVAHADALALHAM